MERRLGVIDLDTGELLDSGVPVWFGRKVRSPYARWVAMNQDFLQEFAARKDVGLEDWRVFIYLNARLDFENLIHVSQVEVADALGMKRQNVNRSMLKLERLGVILRGPKTGRVTAWRFNPNAGWKGKVRQLRTALDVHHLQVVQDEESGAR
jgi:hypothetical protein